MGRTVIIAQARMSSTRLPGKTLMDLGGKPVVDHVIERARDSRLADDVWVATTSDPTDDVLVEHLQHLEVPHIRGSLDDVLARYVQAAEASQAVTIVRITCDCPLIDPEVIDEVIGAYRELPAVDYCSNTLLRTYPIGMDTEAFSVQALACASLAATETPDREHVTPYIYQHPDAFRLRNVEAPRWATHPEVRLTVDELADLDALRTLVSEVGSGAHLREIVAAIEDDPRLPELNREVPHRHVEKPTQW